MGRRINPEMKIVQKPVGYYFYQHRFFAKHKEFKPDKHSRFAVNQQIKLKDPEFWATQVPDQIKEEDAKIGDQIEKETN